MNQNNENNNNKKDLGIEDLMEMILGVDVKKIKEKYAMMNAFNLTVEDVVYKRYGYTQDQISSSALNETKYFAAMGILMDICTSHNLNMEEEIGKRMGNSVRAAVETCIKGDPMTREDIKY